MRKRVAGNILHVLSEEFVLNPFTSDPFVQLKMSLRAGTGGLSPNDPEDNMWGKEVEMGPARVDVKWAMARRKMHQHIRFTPMNFLLEKVSMAAKCSRMFHRALMEMFIRRRRNPVREWTLLPGLQRTLVVVLITAFRRADPLTALKRSDGSDDLGVISPACAIKLWKGERERT